ncbi:MAG: aldose 1-epimerase family protein [Ruminococcus sp.]|nr:aldose 1-epimerase family protein [Ruminococcus sp.]
MEVTKTIGNLSFTADEQGAELHSLKLSGEEYLWQCGDAWKRYAPVLFPFICSPKDNKYKANGKEYTMLSNHGFARDSRFELTAQDDAGVEFTLKSNDKTKACYPYDFCLKVIYKINDGELEVKSIVTNNGEGNMYFYLGGHPAFICDIESGECVVEYECDETIVQPTPNGERTVLNNERILMLNRKQFDYDVIMKDHPASSSVTLKRNDGRYVCLRFPQSECIAVWTVTGNKAAQFICLEPWTSVPVYADDEFDDIEKKPHAICLASGEAYEYKYFIEIGKL